MNHTVQAAKNLSPMFGTALLKTWTNGWITDSRVGASSTSPCRCGCDHDIPKNADRRDHYLECEPLWENIHHAYNNYANIQLTQSRHHSLCLIPPWESETTDPKEITHHLMCLGAAVDVYNHLSNRQKLQTGKCHAKGDTKLTKIDNRTIALSANEAVRRINKLKKNPKPQHPSAHNNNNNTRGNADRTISSSTSESSSSSSSSNNNDSATIADDGQLRVTSSSKPLHGRENEESRSVANDKPRSVAVKSNHPPEDSASHICTNEQPRLPPPTPSVGASGDCSTFDVSCHD